MNTIKVGVLGTGQVGKTLALGFKKHGYDVMIGSRHPEKLNDWLKETNSDIKTGSFSEAAAHGDIVVLAVKGAATLDALDKAGKENIKNKIIVDATNPISDAAPEKGIIKLFTTHDKSLMEELQKCYPNSKFVKSFSCIGAPFMVNPDCGGQLPTMFICGNDDKAKSAVKEILTKFGFETEDLGGVEAARVIEPLCILWCIPGFRENRWNNAFKFLKVNAG